MPVVVVSDTFDFSKPVTLKAGNVYYFNGSNQYSISSTLTIEAGAVLKFPKTIGAAIWIVSAGGKVIANGTSANPIIFTSEKDDSPGGDSNGDCAGSTPSLGNWSYIVLDGDGSNFNYCKFLYNGSGSDDALFEITGNDNNFDHCTFAHCKGSTTISGRGVVAYADNVLRASFTNNVMYDNVKPLSMNSGMSIDSSNIFHNPDNASQKNTYQGIFIDPNLGTLTNTNIAWLENEVPFVVFAYYQTQSMQLISNNLPVTFTLGQGVIIKFVATASATEKGPGIWIKSSISQIVGYNLPGVYFTSYKDDAHGGDTNADGSATSPSGGEWNGIYDYDLLVNAPTYYYNWSNILYSVN